MRTAAVVVVVAGALTLAACANQTDSSPLDGKLLTTDDMPSGYTVRGSAGLDDVLPVDADEHAGVLPGAAHCPALADFDPRHPWADEAGAAFGKPASERVGESGLGLHLVRRFATARDARAAIVALAEGIDGCESFENGDGLLTSFVSSPQAAAQGDERIVVRFVNDVSTSGLSLNGEAAFVRRGDRLMHLYWIELTGPPMEAEDFAAITAAAEAKL